ncbi:MAG: hypothetical protein QNL43_02065 [Crocinitomicaceae bacterium]
MSFEISKSPASSIKFKFQMSQFEGDVEVYSLHLQEFMRLIKRIPHDRYLIELHQYNQKMILKISLDHYEQIFKIPESENYGQEEFETLVNSSEFLSNCLKRFITMREDFTSSFNSISK